MADTSIIITPVLAMNPPFNVLETRTILAIIQYVTLRIFILFEVAGRECLCVGNYNRFPVVS